MDWSTRVTAISLALEWNSMTLGREALQACVCSVPVPWRELSIEGSGRAICSEAVFSICFSLCTCLVRDLTGVSCREGLGCLGGRPLGCPALEGSFLGRQRWEPQGARALPLHLTLWGFWQARCPLGS